MGRNAPLEKGPGDCAAFLCPDAWRSLSGGPDDGPSRAANYYPLPTDLYRPEWVPHLRTFIHIYFNPLS